MHTRQCPGPGTVLVLCPLGEGAAMMRVEVCTEPGIRHWELPDPTGKDGTEDLGLVTCRGHHQCPLLLQLSLRLCVSIQHSTNNLCLPAAKVRGLSPILHPVPCSLCHFSLLLPHPSCMSQTPQGSLSSLWLPHQVWLPAGRCLFKQLDI